MTVLSMFAVIGVIAQGLAPTVQTVSQAVLTDIVAIVTAGVVVLVAIIAVRAIIEAASGGTGVIGKLVGSLAVLLFAITVFIARDQIVSLIPIS